MVEKLLKRTTNTYRGGECREKRRNNDGRREEERGEERRTEREGEDGLKAVKNGAFAKQIGDN